MNEEKMEVMTMEDNDTGIKGQLMSVSDQYCSFVPQGPEDKKRLFKAMNNPEKRLADCINMTIKVQDIYSEIVVIVDQNTGEMIKAPRIVLIDADGVGYQCVSKGIFSALKKLIAIFGAPTWEGGLPLTVKQITKGSGKNTRSLLTFDVALED